MIHTLHDFLPLSEFQTKLSMKVFMQATKESEWLCGNCLQSEHSSSKGRSPEEQADPQCWTRIPWNPCPRWTSAWQCNPPPLGTGSCMEFFRAQSDIPASSYIICSTGLWHHTLQVIFIVQSRHNQLHCLFMSLAFYESFMLWLPGHIDPADTGCCVFGKTFFMKTVLPNQMRPQSTLH